MEQETSSGSTFLALPENPFGTVQGGLLVQEGRGQSPPPEKAKSSASDESAETIPANKPGTDKQQETTDPDKTPAPPETEEETEEASPPAEDRSAHLIELSTGVLDTTGMSKKQVADRVKLDAKLVALQAERDRYKAEAQQSRHVPVEAEPEPAGQITQADVDAKWAWAKEQNDADAFQEAINFQFEFRDQQARTTLLSAEDRALIEEFRGTKREQAYQAENLADAEEIIESFAVKDVTPEEVAAAYDEAFKAEVVQFYAENPDAPRASLPVLLERFKATKEGQMHWSRAIAHAREVKGANGGGSVSDKGVASPPDKTPKRLNVAHTSNVGAEGKRGSAAKGGAKDDFSLSAAMSKI